MKRAYTVLRRLSATTAGPFEVRGLEPGIEAIGAEAMDAHQIEVRDLDAKEVKDAAAAPDVAAVAPVMPVSLIAPMAGAAQQTAWGISAVKADTSGCTGSGVTVAILDTGIKKDHPGFQGVQITEQDFTGSSNGDRNGHGTHCAGTIFGRDVNGTRIGIARGVNHAFIGKVLRDDGGGDSDTIFRGIQWAVQQGADVISMSLGFDFPGFVKRMTDAQWPVQLATSAALEAYRGNLRMFDTLMAMVQARAAFTQGTLIVAAAGNESQRNVNPDFKIGASLPAAAQGVISVGALLETPQGYGIANFSNTFPQISAPGFNILSAGLDNGLRSLSGTSMACPHVTGVAALWWEAVRKLPRPTAATVLVRLLGSARPDVFEPGVDPADRGAGIAAAP
jgi:subtilisin family serine protease